MSLLILFIIAVCLLVFAVKVSRRNKEESEKCQTAEMPKHFDLLDYNGDPINSSDDRDQSSEAPHIRVVVDSGDGKDASVQELQYFCIKDKGYHVSVWPKDRDQFDVVEFSIAGITHGEHVDDHLGEFIAALVSDPDNQYEPKSIKIVTSEGHRIGYVPRDMTSEVRRVATLPCTCYCYIGIYQHAEGPHYFTHCYIDKY